MAVTRINNNQITDAQTGNAYVGVNAASKLQDYTITSAKIANNLVYGSDLTISGNLTVNGETTTIDTTVTTIEDPVIVLASNQTGSPTVDIGFIGERGTSENVAFVWDESANEFVTVFTNDLITNTTVTISSYASFHTNDANVAGNLTVGGNIAITGNASITGNVASLNVTGNVSGGNVYTSGEVSASGNITGGNLSTSGSGGSITLSGGNITGANVISSTTLSASGNVEGGSVYTVGNVTGGNIYTGGEVSATGNVTGGNIVTNGSFTANSINVIGNIDGGNINTLGEVSASGNITGGNLKAANLSLSGNVVSDLNVSSIVTASNVAVTSLDSGEIAIAYTNGQLVGGPDLFWQFSNSRLFVTNIDSNGSFTTSGSISSAGNVTGGNFLTGGLISATGTITSFANINGGNISTSGQISAAGNINTGANIVANGNVSGSNIVVTGGNITGANVVIANTISANGVVSAGGNVVAGNVTTAGEVSATGNVTGGNVNTAVVNNDSGSITISGNTNVILSPLNGNIDASSSWINNVADPVQAYDAATKQYVDDAVSSGITIHTPVYVESPTALNATYAQGGNTFTVNQTIAGNTVVFSTAANLQPNDQLWFSNSFQGIVANKAYFVVSTPNTSAAVLSDTYGGAPVANITSGTSLTESVRVNSGIGATLTNAGSNATLVVDGVTLTNGQRVLVYTQANAVHNGVYVVSEAGNATTAWQLTRSTDTDVYGPKSTDELDVGDYFYVQAGDTGAGESYVMTAPTGPFVIGYDNLTFTQFSASQVYTANTNAGLSLTGTVFSAKVDNDTTAFDGGGNIIVKAGANLVTPNIGSATGTSLSVTGNVVASSLESTGDVSAVGNVIGGTISTTGNITGGNLSTSGSGGSITLSGGNITGANVISSTTLSATGNVEAGNIVTSGSGGDITLSSGNITGANVISSTTLSASGDVIGGNLVTGGTANITGNINGSGAEFTGNVTAQNFIGNISGNIDAGGSNTEIQFNDDNLLAGSPGFTFDKTSNAVSVTGNINAGNVSTGGNVQVGTAIFGVNIDGSNASISATGTIQAGNLSTGGTVSATGNVIGGNITTTGEMSATGNISAGNIVTTGSGGDITLSGGNITGATAITATGNIVGGNIIANGTVTGGNITVGIDGVNSIGSAITFNSNNSDVDFAVNGDTVANVFYVDAGTGTASFGTETQTTGAIVAFNSPDSVLMPVGNTAQRPGSATVGMLRFNTLQDGLEVYTTQGWEAVGVPVFTVISDEQFTGDGSTLVFTLGSSQTTASCIVSINGVIQIPTIAYSVSGTTLTFTEAPQPGDIIDVRQITTTTTVIAISNTSGNAVIATSENASAINVTGNLIPVANVTYDLGSSTNRWRDGYFAGNSITLGNVVMKNVAGGNTIAFYGPDGTTPATIASTSVDTTTIANGTSSVSVVTSGGNIRANVAGSTVALVTSSGVQITGDLSVTGNATLSGNILGDRIQNGTTQIDIQTINGNANISVAGTSNVAVFAPTGLFVSGLASVTGNITGGNVAGTNLTGTLLTASQTNITSVGTLGSLSVTGNITGGNVAGTNLTGTLLTASQTNITSVGTLGSLSVTGNITGGNILGGANVNATTHTGTTVSVTGNITGGNILGGANVNATTHTGATVSVTGAITGGSLTVSTGNITGGNLILSGAIEDSAQLDIRTTASNGNIVLTPNGTGVIVANKDIVNGQANGVGNIGSATGFFNTVFAKATSAQYADLAEKYVADAAYEPGTVLVFGGSKEVTVSAADADRRVAGVVSTNPSYIMNGGLEAEHVATVALTGRVPCRVTGQVRKGDLMVSAGYGMARAEQDPRVGTVIGKALEDFDGQEGVIEVVVGRF